MLRLLARTLVVIGSLTVVTIVPLASHTARTTEAGSPIIVTTTADSGTGSFRQALNTAGTNPGLDVITFDPTVFPPSSGTTITATAAYVIESAAASQPLTIDGTGASVVIDAQFVNNGDSALHFRPTGPFSGLTLRNFVIQNFHTDAGGNGVEVGFQVTTVSDILIEHMTFQGNGSEGVSLNAAGLMSNVVIQDSISRINQGNGIFIKATSLADVQLLRNDIRNNDRNGIELKAESSDSLQLSSSPRTTSPITARTASPSTKTPQLPAQALTSPSPTTPQPPTTASASTSEEAPRTASMSPPTTRVTATTAPTSC